MASPQKQLALAKISRPRLHDVQARTRLFGLLDKAGCPHTADEAKARAVPKPKRPRGAA